MGDVERCLLEASHSDGWTHKQRGRSKVPSVVTARVRPSYFTHQLKKGTRCSRSQEPQSTLSGVEAMDAGEDDENGDRQPWDEGRWQMCAGRGVTTKSP